MNSTIDSSKNFAWLVNLLISFMNPVIAILSGIAVIIFFWGLVRYVASAGNDSGKEFGRSMMMWGVITLFLLFSLYGVLSFLKVAFFGTGLQ